MQFLVLSHRHSDRFTPEQYAEHLPAETQRVRQLYARGVIQQIWQRDDLRGAAFLVSARSLSAAQAAVGSLPLARLQMSEFTVIPLRPYQGFGPDAALSDDAGAQP
jgi:muconolactone delta-isomerase